MREFVSDMLTVLEYFVRQGSEQVTAHLSNTAVSVFVVIVLTVGYIAFVGGTLSESEVGEKVGDLLASPPGCAVLGVFGLIIGIGLLIHWKFVLTGFCLITMLLSRIASSCGAFALGKSLGRSPRLGITACALAWVTAALIQYLGRSMEAVIFVNIVSAGGMTTSLAAEAREPINPAVLLGVFLWTAVGFLFSPSDFSTAFLKDVFGHDWSVTVFSWLVRCFGYAIDYGWPVIALCGCFVVLGNKK